MEDDAYICTYEDLNIFELIISLFFHVKTTDNYVNIPKKYTEPSHHPPAVRTGKDDLETFGTYIFKLRGT